MAIVLLVMIVILFIYYSFNLSINHKIETYLQSTQTKHLSSIGVNEDQFIGLHRKALALPGAFMIYARKTTAYKGVLLFVPDVALSDRFYMPLINFLCRQGYIIATYQTSHAFYTQAIDDIQALYDCVLKDDVLSTYPLSFLGHGSSATISLCATMERIQTYVLFQPRSLEIEEILKQFKHPHPKIREWIIKNIKKTYHCDLSLVPLKKEGTYVIYGDSGDYTPLKSFDATIKVLNGVGQYPFLNMDGEQRLKSLECLLAYPNTSQFEYNKALETFDATPLYDLNKEVLDILPYLFENPS